MEKGKTDVKERDHFRNIKQNGARYFLMTFCLRGTTTYKRQPERTSFSNLMKTKDFNFKQLGKLSTVKCNSYLSTLLTVYTGTMLPLKTEENATLFYQYQHELGKREARTVTNDLVEH
jgi:hypothetical protein